MADEVIKDEQIVELRDDFYQDGHRLVIGLIVSVFVAIAAILVLSLYLFLHKPLPTIFPTDKEWRVQPEIAVNQPYLTTPDLLQWVSNVMLKVFVYDFINYNKQLKSYMPYFTDNGWQVFMNQLNNFANYNNVQNNKQFINVTADGAPYILKQGLLDNRYAWWVQIPLNLNYYGSYNRFYVQTVTLQVLVVRVSTLNNLDGVAIDNIIVANNTNQTSTRTIR